MAEHAIHFWKRCPTRPQNIVVERNWIINCDRGIGFGLTNLDGGHQGGASVIRNNFVYNNGAGPKTDVGIGLEYADSVRVDNNTVVIPSYWAPIEHRFPGSSNLVFRNNLVSGPITLRNGAPAAGLSNNLESIQTSWFRDLPAGDLHLTPAANAVIDAGQPIDAFSDDIDGDARPRQTAWDIGADEYDPARADSDGDGMSDQWESNGGLDPLNASGPDGADGDPDGDAVLNLAEFIADTAPNDALSHLRLVANLADNGHVRIRWQGGVESSQRLERRQQIASAFGDWEVVTTLAPPTPEISEQLDAITPSGSAWYRIQAIRP
jgi:hypothetical protein